MKSSGYIAKSVLFCVSGLSVSVPAVSGDRTERGQFPNIVFILADDMGIGDVGCYGQELIQTPNIDALARHGIRFTRHYAGSTVSAPSRCCLLTGKDTGHSFIRGNKGDGRGFDYPMQASETTVAEVLKRRNYATACVGKWGLGGVGTDGHPNNQGFDYFFGYLGQGAAHNYYPEFLYENSDTVYLGGKVYSHFVIVDKGLDFIKKHADEPFFVYFAVTPPHADLDYPNLGVYDGKFEEVPYENKSKSGGYKSQPKPRAAYASMVSEVDRNVAEIVDLLDSLSIMRNTIIIFSSDNGVHCVGGHDPDYFNSNGIFRGYKRDLYEGGVRTPFIVRWDGHIAPGSETDHISAFWDFLPTVCDLVDLPAPEDINGISYLPTLTGKGRQCKHDYIYYEFYERGGKQSVMRDGWKLVRLNMSYPEKYKEELYNIDNDISEENNLIDRYPEKAANLRELADKARFESLIFKW